MLYRVLVAIDLIVAAVLGYYLLQGLAEGWISSFNAEIWAVIVFAVAAVLLGGHLFRRAGYAGLANAVLALLAVPGVTYGFFLCVVIFSGTSWN
jgi:hypothetical protein